MTGLRAASNYLTEALSSGWQLAEVPAEPFGDVKPALERELAALAWEDARVPGTVASARRESGSWSFDSKQDFDASDFWYRCHFQSAPAAAGESIWLRFDGLATLVDVWLNGAHVLRSDNMFLAHELDVSGVVASENELTLRFASVATETSVRRPRPRFRTRLIDRQQLRWIRTTLLGRMPGWSPPAAPVGPWREVTLERRRGFSLDSSHVRPQLEASAGHVDAAFSLSRCSAPISSARLRVGDQHAELAVQVTGATASISGRLTLPEPELWWPHSHGSQPSYAVSLELVQGELRHELQLGSVAFRSIRALRDDDGFALVVNGQAVRAFGACWTPPDVVSLHDPAAAVVAVGQARAAGMTMLRVGGTMVYECDAFYQECERLGIMVWQDFMFANCDYPAEDAAFSASVRREATQLLQRLESRACVCVLCGSSEVEQQISMLGLPREQWQPALFERELAGLCRELIPDVPYVPSTPTGGALPFQANAGVTHYYGVGAYLRPLEDARRAQVRFAAECLAFANVPEQATLDELLGDVRAPFHEPRWKARVPRDNGAGWDFDDVRDHYVRELFGVDPMLLRYQDPQRALALARVASGEVMQRTLCEWRRQESSCRGALIWLFRDLWPGAGWGLVDALGRPKAAYFYVKRALQPRGVLISDEGVNGLCLELTNASPEAVQTSLEIALWRAPAVKVAAGAVDIALPAHGNARVAGASLFEHFIDLTHAYRFGPPAYDVAVVQLRDVATRAILAEDAYFPGRRALERGDDLGLQAVLHEQDGAYRLRVSCSSFAQAVAVEVPGYIPDDSYFHLAPGVEKWIGLTADASSKAAPPRGALQPLNARSSVRITRA